MKLLGLDAKSALECGVCPHCGRDTLTNGDEYPDMALPELTETEVVCVNCMYVFDVSGYPEAEAKLRDAIVRMRRMGDYYSGIE